MEEKEKIELYKWLAIASGTITLFVSLLLFINFIQTKTHEPLENEALKRMVEMLKDDPNNETLKLDIRSLDLLARKAYFTGVRQIKAGSMLLLLSSVILIISIRQYRKLVGVIALPTEEPDVAKERERSQKGLFAAGILILGLALLAAFFTTDHLNNYGKGLNSDEILVQATDKEEEVIEVVNIVPVSQKEQDTEASVELKEVKEDAVISKETITVEEKTPVPVEVKKEHAKVVEDKQIEPVKKVSSFPNEEKLKKEFNAFRGYNGNGVSFHENIPSSWDVASGENILWHIDLPKKGYNSPIIWEDKLFLTGADKSSRVVYCYNSLKGSLLWQKELSGIPGSPATPPKTTDDTGLAAPSVTTDGQRVFAIFGTGDIIALNMNGEQLWARNLGVPENHYGHSSSLMVLENRLFVQYDTGKGGLVMALDVNSGNELWKTPREVSISWSSPILAQIGEQWQLILSSEPLVAGYDVETGTELWQYDCMMGEVGPSPAFANGLVYATNEYAKLIAFEPGNEPRVAWEDDEYLPEVASPVVSDGLLFIATTYGVMACYDAHTGNKYWEKEFDQGFYSSPMVAEGRVYIADVEGIVHILKVDREAQVIADIEMGEGVFATPSFSNGKIFIRTETQLYCIGK